MASSAFPVLLTSITTLLWALASVRGQGSQASPSLYRSDYWTGFQRDPYYPNHPYPRSTPPPPHLPLYYVQVNPSPAHLYPYIPHPSSPHLYPYIPPPSSPHLYPYSPHPSSPYHRQFLAVSPSASTPNLPPGPGSAPGYPRYQYATVASPSPQPLPTRGGGGRGEEVDGGTVKGSGGGGGGPVFNTQAFAEPAQALPAWPYGTMEKVTSGSAASGQGGLYQLPQVVGGQGLLEAVARVRRPSPARAPAVRRLSSLANNNNNNNNNNNLNPLLLMLALNSLS